MTVDPLVSFLTKAITYARAGVDISRLIGKADDYSDGVMVAFYPTGDLLNYLQPLADVDGPHLTLAYLGTTGEQAVGLEEAVKCVTHFAEAYPPIRGRLNGLARFCGTGEGKDAIVALYDSPELPGWRQALVDHLAFAQLRVKTDHGFIPHITLGYIPQDAPTPDLRVAEMPSAFNTIYLVWGTQTLPFRLGGV